MGVIAFPSFQLSVKGFVFPNKLTLFMVMRPLDDLPPIRWHSGIGRYDDMMKDVFVESTCSSRQSTIIGRHS